MDISVKYCETPSCGVLLLCHYKINAVVYIYNKEPLPQCGPKYLVLGNEVILSLILSHLWLHLVRMVGYKCFKI